MMLTSDSAVLTKEHPVSLPMETTLVDTRFGPYEFTPENTIIIPNGLIGFADQQSFGIGNLPPPVPEDFKLLQSLGDLPLSLIVISMSSDETPFEAADLDTACTATGFVRDQIHVMFLCTIRPTDDGAGIDIWANIRAPILFDMEARHARQYVMSSDRYPLRQPLDKWNGAL
jgi:flagellar assembly factor FliW